MEIFFFSFLGELKTVQFHSAISLPLVVNKEGQRSIEMGFKIIGLWFLLALKAKYLAKYSFLIEVTLLKAGEGFKIAVHHHLDQPIMSIQELDLSPGSVFQVCRCR